MDNLYVRAVHEAGHAFAFQHFRLKVVAVRIGETRVTVLGAPASTTGETEVTQLAKPSRDNIAHYVVCLRAADDAANRIDPPEAERIKEIDAMMIDDYLKQVELTREERAIVLSESAEYSKRLVEENFGTIRKLAEALLQKQHLTGDEVRKIIRDCGTAPTPQ